MRDSFLPACGVLLVGLFGFVAVAAEATADLDWLIDDHWEFTLKENPQFATRVGDRRFRAQLEKVSLADADRRNRVTLGFLRRAEGIDAEGLSPDERVTLALLTRQLRDDAAEHRFLSHLTPINNRRGFHIDFPDLPKDSPLVSVEDYENYLARLKAFPAYADGQIELMREGVRRGVTQPAVIFDGWEESVDSHIVGDPTASVFYEPFESFPATVPESEHARLTAAGAEAIADSIVPTYKRFRRFMAEEYVPSCRTSVGASALPDGREFYRYRVRRFTTIETTPEEVHQRGLAEVKRIRGEMDAIRESVGFDGDLAAFIAHLRTAPEFYAKTEEELLSRCAYVLKKADGRLPALFGHLPRMPYGVRPVPEFIAPKATMAYYKRPAGDGSQAGFYYLNTYNLPARPLYLMEALSLHEAVPGHHLQIAVQQELEGVPNFRRYGGFTAFTEGWALYAERLGIEMGFYQDPYSDFGRLSMEVWRACRLVVDTGVHYLGWTRQQAIDFLLENSAASEHNIRAEVDRYIGWPGQALAYKTGELKIRELRARAEEQLGGAFDVRAFHDLLLGGGALPLDVLEENVDRWIREQRGGESTARRSEKPGPLDRGGFR